jgi:hypothetical protein
MRRSKLLWGTLPVAALLFNFLFAEGRPVVRRAAACENFELITCPQWCGGCCAPYSTCFGSNHIGYGWDSECGYSRCQHGSYCNQC